MVRSSSADSTRRVDGGNPDAGTGYGGADFFLGLPESYGHGIAGGGWHQRQSVIAGYVQDQWHVTNSLTLDLGLRYEAFTPWVEVNDLQVNATLFGGQIIAPNCAKLGTIPYSCQKGSRGLYDGTYGGPAFQPRIGFAWSPRSMDGKTVLRGAFTTSSYMEGTGTNLRLSMNVPVTAPEILKQFNGKTAPTSTSQGIVAPPPGDPFAGALFRMWDPHVQPALTEQWNLTLQQQLNNSTTVQVGYVGQHGTHLMVPMPYLQRQLLADGTVAPSAYLAGNPTLQSDLSQISGTASVGSMKYNALQAVLQKRYASGLQYQVAYRFLEVHDRQQRLLRNVGINRSDACKSLLPEYLQSFSRLRRMLLRCETRNQRLRCLRPAIRQRKTFWQRHELRCECGGRELVDQPDHLFTHRLPTGPL